VEQGARTIDGAAYVPLSFARGESYQFDWSHEVVLLMGVTVIVKAAHVRLCHSRMLFARTVQASRRSSRDLSLIPSLIPTRFRSTSSPTTRLEVRSLWHERHEGDVAGLASRGLETGDGALQEVR
jgi:hypothetical protein